MSESHYDKLNAKQRKFCEEYVKDNNGAKAAIKAGYGERSARSKASQLLTIVNVRGYIDELKAEMLKQCQIEAHAVLEMLLREAQDLDNPGSTRVQAQIALGKHIGLFTDKVEHSGDTEAPRVIKRIAVYKNEAGELIEEDLETGEEVKLSPQ